MPSKSRESGGLTTVVWCVALYSCILEFSELNDSYLKTYIYKFTVNLLRALKQMQVTRLTIHRTSFQSIFAYSSIRSRDVTFSGVTNYTVSASTSGRIEARKSAVLFTGFQPIERDRLATHREFEPRYADCKKAGK